MKITLKKLIVVKTDTRTWAAGRTKTSKSTTSRWRVSAEFQDPLLEGEIARHVMTVSTKKEKGVTYVNIPFGLRVYLEDRYRAKIGQYWNTFNAVSDSSFTIIKAKKMQRQRTALIQDRVNKVRETIRKIEKTITRLIKKECKSL